MRNFEMEEIKVLTPRMPLAVELLPYLERIDQSKFYTNFGPLNAELIERLKSVTGFNGMEIVTAANATLALQGLIATSKAPIDAIWDCPAWTFTATPAALSQANVDFNFIDISQEGTSLSNSLSQFRVEVWPFGLRPDHTSVHQNIQRCIIDAAAGFDSVRDFNFSDQTCVAIVVSLHATKLLGAGEGAFIVTNDSEWALRFKSWTNFGITEGRVSEFVGTNAKLSEYAAAVALASLDSWSETRKELKRITKIARGLTLKHGLTSYMCLHEEYVTPYWILKLESKSAKENFERKAVEASIQLRDWWSVGCHEMPAYRAISKEILTNTEEFAGTTIGLPFHTYLKNEDWVRIDTLLSKLTASDYTQ